MNTLEMPSIKEQMANMRQLEDKDIDLSDIPEILDWTGATRGKLFRSAQVAEIRKGLAEADAGDFATDEESAALDAKWGYRAD